MKNCLVLAAVAAMTASAGAVTNEWPFAILRSYGSYADNRLFTDRVFAAQERHPGLFEEIWFGGDGGIDFPAEERGRLAAEKNAGVRERCRQLGIAFSCQQGVTPYRDLKAFRKATTVPKPQRSKTVLTG